MALSKTFAIDEILTAQDVNDHLVNRITRTVLTGEDVVASLEGSATISAAYAIVDRDDVSGLSSVTFYARLFNVVFPSGPSVTSFGQVADVLRPPAEVPLVANSGSDAVSAEIMSGGALRVRYSTADRSSGGTLRLAGSYVVLP